MSTWVLKFVWLIFKIRGSHFLKIAENHEKEIPGKEVHCNNMVTLNMYKSKLRRNNPNLPPKQNTLPE